MHKIPILYTQESNKVMGSVSNTFSWTHTHQVYFVNAIYAWNSYIMRKMP